MMILMMMNDLSSTTKSQGWRRSMEDAHLAVPSIAGDDMASIFGVFDGHGGE